jgi:hypothetical protein
MSPNGWVGYNSDEELCGYDGERKDPVHTWTFDEFQDVFDDLLGEEEFRVTPSVYRFCCDYVEANISRREQYSIDGGEYESEGVERKAVETYLDLDEPELEEIHETAMRSYEEGVRKSEARERAVDGFMTANASVMASDSEMGREVRNFLFQRREHAARKTASMTRKLESERHWHMPPALPDEDEQLEDPGDGDDAADEPDFKTAKLI